MIRFVFLNDYPGYGVEKKRGAKEEMGHLVGSYIECWHGLVANGEGKKDVGGKLSDCRRAGVEHVKLSFLV